jgi:hypothetical protein
VVYEVVAADNLPAPVEVFRPTIRPTQPWILAITITEIPRNLVAAAADSSMGIVIAGAVAAVVVVGAGVGAALWFLWPRAPYIPVPTGQPMKRRLPAIFVDLKAN